MVADDVCVIVDGRCRFDDCPAMVAAGCDDLGKLKRPQPVALGLRGCCVGGSTFVGSDCCC